MSGIENYPTDHEVDSAWDSVMEIVGRNIHLDPSHPEFGKPRANRLFDRRVVTGATRPMARIGAIIRGETVTLWMVGKRNTLKAIDTPDGRGMGVEIEEWLMHGAGSPDRQIEFYKVAPHGTGLLGREALVAYPYDREYPSITEWELIDLPEDEEME